MVVKNIRPVAIVLCFLMISGCDLAKEGYALIQESERARKFLVSALPEVAPNIKVGMERSKNEKLYVVQLVNFYCESNQGEKRKEISEKILKHLQINSDSLDFFRTSDKLCVGFIKHASKNYVVANTQRTEVIENIDILLDTLTAAKP